MKEKAVTFYQHDDVRPAKWNRDPERQYVGSKPNSGGEYVPTEVADDLLLAAKLYQKALEAVLAAMPPDATVPLHAALAIVDARTNGKRIIEESEK